ncbi:MOSC domain-containing protein [Robertmurraya massiliosenegalensis]|uniref:MOSC domain-containing protein n=1 Tax=Robertmurraya massiliosenegalensis TaxID=1287657 RepID=UPI00030CFDF4|nr:MOSC domain-containing protein [Robertmurraya massiliosenegalensis]
MQSQTIHLINLAIGKPKDMRYGSEEKILNTAIQKEIVKEAHLMKEGFIGDGVADLVNHGGFDRAVCFYPAEHYSFWEKAYGKTLESSSFGENITISGLDERTICIGDIVQIGEATVQITEGRVPCKTIDRRTGMENQFKKMIETGYTGYFGKVLKEGKIRSDDNISIISRNEDAVTVYKAHQIFFRQIVDEDTLEQLITNPSLSDNWLQHLKRLQRSNE